MKPIEFEEEDKIPLNNRELNENFKVQGFIKTEEVLNFNLDGYFDMITDKKSEKVKETEKK